ncbi:MAG: peptidylprolyl isomerase [Planctomycetaceae bacterium]
MRELAFRMGPMLQVIGVMACVGDSWVVAAQSVSDSAVLVTVNGAPIHQSELELQMMMRQIPAQDRSRYQRAIIEQLVDQQLVRVHLQRSAAQVNPKLMERQMAQIQQLIRRRGGDPIEVLKTLGLDEAGLKRALSLPLTWQAHMRATITSDQLRSYFTKHRARFDGTRVRAAQILIAAKTPEQRSTAVRQLAEIRSKVQDGRLTFERAVALHSQAPSRKQQGDVGFFTYQGKMPLSFTRHAFPLKVGQMSQPFESPFGVHLCRITDRQPGTLSLEDVRSAVFKKLSDQVWSELVARLRSTAKIDWAAASFE